MQSWPAWRRKQPGRAWREPQDRAVKWGCNSTPTPTLAIAGVFIAWRKDGIRTVEGRRGRRHRARAVLHGRQHDNAQSRPCNWIHDGKT